MVCQLKVWEASVQSQVRFTRACGNLINGNPIEGFAPLGFAIHFKKNYKNKMLRLMGIPPKFIFVSFFLYY